MKPDPSARATTVAEVLTIYEQFGPERYDEEITQGEHALQTAALATRDEADEMLVAAALLHDVGHLLDLAGRVERFGEELDLCHEATGSRFLAGLFPPAVTGPIALHVSAKRYLTATDPAYSACLSSGSKLSLARQGGPMGNAETLAFKQKRRAMEAVRLRRWDDGAKLEDWEVLSLDSYADLLVRVARG